MATNTKFSVDKSGIRGDLAYADLQSAHFSKGLAIRLVPVNGLDRKAVRNTPLRVASYIVTHLKGTADKIEFDLNDKLFTKSHYESF